MYIIETIVKGNKYWVGLYRKEFSIEGLIRNAVTWEDEKICEEACDLINRKDWKNHYMVVKK